MSILTVIRRFGRSVSGATAVEFAIVANLMLMMLVGAFSAGYFFFVKNDMENSISAAERHALVLTESDEDLKAIIRKGLSGYKAADVGLTFDRKQSGGINFVKVDLTYTMSFGSRLSIPPITLSSTRIFPT